MEDEELLNQLTELYERVQYDTRGNDKVYLGEIYDELAGRIKTETGINVLTFKIYITFDQLRHIYLLHGKEFDKAKDQRPVVSADIENIPHILKNFDTVRFNPKDSKLKRYQDGFMFLKNINTPHHLAVEISYKNSELLIKTFYIKNR